MKTFRTIIVTFVATVMVVAGITFGFLVNEGIVTVERESVEHTKVVVVDGEVKGQQRWSELKGLTFKIDVKDQATIGR